MKRIRINNDFTFAWAIERNGLPEDLSTAINMRLLARNARGVLQAITDYTVAGNMVSIEVTPDIANVLGKYNFILTYELPDAGLSDLERLCEIDTDAFILVPRTAEADDAEDFLVTSDMAIGFKGDKGDPFLYEDFTPAQLEALKVKGDAFEYSDFTPEQLEALKVKGDKGDSFEYADFTPEQLLGLKGEQGERGADGVGLNFLGTLATSANLDISYTGNANDAYVTIDSGHAWKWTGTEWLDVGQFKGDKGDKGEQGIQGIQGVKGDKGDTGAQGIQGEKGDKGDTGAQGIQGIKGDKGDTGAQGIQGIQGLKGDTGAQGLQGLKGDKGDTGAQGEKGDKGDTGLQGIQGIQGIQGEKGDKGDKGEKGDKGDKGDTGDTGLSGIYASEIVSSPTTGTLTLKQATETVLDGALTTSNVFTVALPTPVSGKVNESVLIFKIGATLPTITQPSGIVWRGSTPTLAINTNWTIVYEQVNTTGSTFEIWATACKNA